MLFPANQSTKSPPRFVSVLEMKMPTMELVVGLMIAAVVGVVLWFLRKPRDEDE